jgi:hypothetical protein
MTDEELGQLMQQSWNEYPNEWKFDTFKFGRLVAAAEREACAKVCEKRVEYNPDDADVAYAFADAIRARGME